MSNEPESTSARYLENLNASQRIEFVFDLVEKILSEMGVADVRSDAVVIASAIGDGTALVNDSDGFARFNDKFSTETGCLPYAREDVASLTVQQFCQMYLDDSYPEFPRAPLPDEHCRFRGRGGFGAGDGAEQEFPIGFVLGCPRSGTTLLRTMLNMHDQIWAPGELNMAHFANMADRSKMILPMMRYSILDECASRLNESISSFPEMFKAWERDALPVTEIYRKFYEAEPNTLIVDKSPAYSVFFEDLEVIGKRFANAKFIHIVRNPHDMIRSFVKLRMYKNASGLFEPGLSPYQMGEVFWVAHNSNIIQFLSQIPNERKCMLRYEDLVSDPAKQLTKICDLLELPYDPKMADPYGKGTGPVALGASDVHINHFERIEHRRPNKAFYPVGTRCKDLAQNFGY